MHDPVCTLEIMLEARDSRRARQKRHFGLHPDTTLAVATVVAPGEHKLTAGTLTVARAEREALRKAYEGHIISITEYDAVSGPETWITLACGAAEAKRIAAGIEEEHPLGRLFDIDIVLPDLSPMPRSTVGLPPRRCLLCGHEARECMRAGRHSRDEILSHIREMIEMYTTR